jgi:peptidoglycan/xylan/chitin deacetylase (PgdA/CDA1 family)
MKNTALILLSIGTLMTACAPSDSGIGKTEITKWQDGKSGAVSITYDDATINQFRQALPIMDTLGFKGTFFINTTDIPGSQFPPEFIGRPINQIIKETADSRTTRENLFERASALRFTAIDDAVEQHNSAGALFESNKVDEAIKVIDDAFDRVRKKGSTQKKRPVLLTGEIITWPEIKQFAARGHEFGSHTISHPRLAVLDEANLLYEMEKCKEEILNQLGPEHTFSAECPFGTENERVMEYALKIHPALRNRMPEPFLEELNRGNKTWPGIYNKEYIQWQRGPLTKTPMELMKSWVDTLLVHDNVWLVLTFHGVDDIGWEPKPHEEHAEYFRYMKDNEDRLWVATFGDVTRYIRERMNSHIEVKEKDEKILIALKHSLDKNLYGLPLTLKTYVPSGWTRITIKQGERSFIANTSKDEQGSFVLYQAIPNAEDISLTAL